MRLAMLGLLTLLLLAGQAQAAAGRLTGHDLSLTIDPAAHELRATDRLRLAPGGSTLSFLLHEGLEVRRASGGGRPLKPYRGAAHEGLAVWEIEVPPGLTEVVVEYGGQIFEPPRRGETSRHGLATETSGLIGPEGLFLPHPAAFLPWQPGERPALRLTVETPEGYEAVSVGRMASRQTSDGRTRTVWEAAAGEADPFLIGGPLRLHQDEAAGVPIYLYFYPQDADLVPTYAARLRELVPLYTGLLGAFPYPKFAVVENFFPTGLGFPSLTLLGAQVVRLPFILEGSLAHELVHSWWGNSVEPRGGNWAEGLTAYLSDYLLVERQGREEARGERRRLLEQYAAYAPRLKGKQLAEFQEPGRRLDDVLGYTLGALVFHQLRREVGEAAFFAGLRLLAARFRNGHASWDDLRGCFEEAAKQRLGWFFEQWVDRAGAPELALSGGSVTRAGKGYRTVATLSQSGPGGRPWRFRVPLVLEAEDGGHTQRVVVLEGASAKVELTTAARPRCLVVDPEAQVLRRLAPYEVPPRLSLFFAAEDKVYVLPEGPLNGPAREAAERLGAAEPGRIVEAKELTPEKLPPAVMFLGQPPPRLASWFPEAPRLTKEGFTFQGRAYPQEAAAMLVSARQPGQVRVLLFSRSAEGLKTAARFVPHLGRYQWAVFPPAERPVKGEPEPGGWLSLDLISPEGSSP